MDSTPSFVIAFDVLSIIVILLLLAVVLTAACSRQIQRRGSWYNFMLPVTLYQASFLFLLGKQDHSQPPLASCMLQSILIYTLPVYCAIGFACFVLDFYLILRKIFHGQPPSKLTSTLLLIVPPAVSFIILLIFLILFNTSKDMISTFKPDVSGAFCHSDSGIPGWIAVGVSIPGLSVWFYVYLRTALLFKRKREAISTYDKTLRGRIMSVFVRTSLMTVLTCFGVAFSVYVAAIPSHEELPFSVFQYLALPLSVLLMFGTQAEFFRCWSCKRSTNSLPPDKTGITSM